MDREFVTKTTLLMVNSFGTHRFTDAGQLKELYMKKQYGAMLKIIKDFLNLNLTLLVYYSQDLDWNEASAIIHYDLERLPIYGSKEFDHVRLPLSISKKYLDEESIFEAVVSTFAHEMAHIVLFSIRHSLCRDEKATDIMAMVLGFYEFFEIGRFYSIEKKIQIKKSSLFDFFNKSETFIKKTSFHRGYLFQEEINLVSDLIKQKSK